MIHVYYGDGKGKTTAALGLTLRAAGCGNRCVVVQFLKDWNCGEITALCEMETVTVLRGKSAGASFSNKMTPEQLAATREIHNANFAEAVALASDAASAETCALLVLDELLDAVQLELIDNDAIRALLDAPPTGLEIAITGHGAVDWIIDRADYVTEMVKRRHPFDKGITARRGVEF